MAFAHIHSSCDVTPRPIAHSRVNCSDGHIIFGSQSGERHFSNCIFLAYAVYLLFGQFRRTAALTSRCAFGFAIASSTFLLRHVVHVVVMCPKPQVRRIAAQAIVTFVKSIQAIGFCAGCKKQGNRMGSRACAIESACAIPDIQLCCQPRPAFAIFFDSHARPKLFTELIRDVIECCGSTFSSAHNE